MANKVLSWGVEHLDKILHNALTPNSLVVIAGHAGAGKTTLASSICYANALAGLKCLYVSLQEDKLKLYANMRNLGIDLEGIEGRGLLHFVKLPLIAEADSVSDVVESISTKIAEVKPQVVVVDSITPLLKVFGGKVSERAFLQNFFAEIPHLINGVVVLLVEVPRHVNEVDLGELEFVADVVLFLKVGLERDFISRTLEVGKVRNAEVSVARMPYTIASGVGLKFLPSTVLEEIPSRIRDKLELPCLDLGTVFKGNIIYVTYPPDFRPKHMIAFMVGVALLNKLRVLIISYKSPPEELKEFIVNSLIKAGLNEDLINNLLNNDNVVFKSLNPCGLSYVQLGMVEYELIDKYKPGMVIFHGVDILAKLERISREESYWNGLINEMLNLKKLGTVVVRAGSYDSETYNVYASLSDVIYRFHTTEENGNIKHKVYVWNRGDTPKLITEEQINACLEKLASKLHNEIKIRALTK